MPDDLRVEVQGLSDLKEKLTLLELKAFPRAASKALNRTATTVRAEQSRILAKQMGLRVGDVKRRIDIRKAIPTRLSAQIIYRGKPLNLINFKARQFKKGVKASPWGDRRLFPGTFIVRIGGNDLVMRRARRGGRRVGRLPIEAVFGPGIAKEARSPEVQRARRDVVGRVLVDRLRSNLEFEVSRLRRRG